MCDKTTGRPLEKKADAIDRSITNSPCITRLARHRPPMALPTKPIPTITAMGISVPCIVPGAWHRAMSSRPFDSPTANRIVLTRKKRRLVDPQKDPTWTLQNRMSTE
ncbi:hypothetical protein IG631_06485 [Alternaria alternata]|nr:hypothetical protein IG631_06485 [Alternaria alternata]